MAGRDVSGLFKMFEDASISSVPADNMSSQDDASENERRRQAVFSSSFMMEDDSDFHLDMEPNMIGESYDIRPEEIPETFSERVTVHTIYTGNTNCTHEVALPPGMPFEPLVAKHTEPAKSYPFELDPFQREAIMCIENNQSVLVSAHTSAGKTAVASYAIAQSLRDKQKVIYTSPIKALSNQKFRELQEEFGDVGLITGDATLNPEASCLVMTTEILHCMLYRGAQMMKEVGWVIFDEIHYMRHEERGIVWEESIILLPHSVRHVFLSATILNARQFAEWVSWLHIQPVHIVYTVYRPIPLQHFVFPEGSKRVYEVVSVRGQFHEDNFTKAMGELPAVHYKTARRTGRHRSAPSDDVENIIRIMKNLSMLPCVIFSFNRKHCECYATALENMDFNDDEEKKLVGNVFHSAVEVLNDDDKKLPQIEQMLPLLSRGIGYHHSGLLPFLKEIVEILFGEGLLKILFSTETFSIGLNMPARAVVFTSMWKFDGEMNRRITSGEYTQMSGRAGRRGKDDRGFVILMVDEKINSEDAKKIMKGAPAALMSQFRPTYHMVLNIHRVEGVKPELMLKRSFLQFQKFGCIPDLQRRINRKLNEIDHMSIEHEGELTELLHAENEIAICKNTIKKIMINPRYIEPFLKKGRLLHVICGSQDFGWGVLVEVLENWDGIKTINVLLKTQRNHRCDDLSTPVLHSEADDKPLTWCTREIGLDCVEEIGAAVVNIPSKHDNETFQCALQHEFEKIKLMFGNGIPVLNPITDMCISEAAFVKAVQRVAELKQQCEESWLRKIKNFDDLKKQWHSKARAKQQLKVLYKELRESQSVVQLDELCQKKRLLHRLDYIDLNDCITDKGRCAGEISFADGIVLTEMLYDGVFEDLTAAEIAALLSCFVFQESTGTHSYQLPAELSGCLETLYEYARRIDRLSKECQIYIYEERERSFKPHLMRVVYQWMRGVSFEKLIATSKVFAGSIIRCFRRVDELLKEMMNAAIVMNNKELRDKFENARDRIERNVAFAASLYL